MAKVNSWGRHWKKQISVTFKKDEQIIENFINEKVDPTSYIKELILKDMKLINEDNVNIQNTTKYTEKNNNDRFLDAKSAEKLEKMFEL